MAGSQRYSGLSCNNNCMPAASDMPVALGLGSFVRKELPTCTSTVYSSRTNNSVVVSPTPSEVPGPTLSVRSPQEAGTLANSMFAQGSFLAGSFVPGSKLSRTALAFNLVLGIVGTTILAIAAQLKRTGWLLTPGLLFLCCAISMEMAWVQNKIVQRLAAEGEVTSYLQFAEGALGDWGRRVVSVTSIGGNLGLLCISLVLESQSLQYALPIHWTWPWPGEDRGYRWWSLFLTLPMLCYCCMDTARILRVAGVIAPFVCITCFSCAVAGSSFAIGESGTIPRDCKDSPTPYTSWGPDASSSFFDIVLDVAGVSSYCCFCFAVCSLTPSLRSQMEHPDSIMPVVRGSFMGSTFLFLVIMVTGYAGFGNLGPDNIILGMRMSRPRGWWAMEQPWEKGGSESIIGQVYAWTTIVNLLLSDAVYVPCSIISLEALAPHVFQNRRVAQVILRLLLTGFRLSVANLTASFYDLTILTSACFIVTNNILVPVVGFRMKEPHRISPLRKVVHIFIAVFGLYVMVFGSIGAIANMASGAAPQAGTALRLHISPQCEKEYRHAVGLDDTILRVAPP